MQSSGFEKLEIITSKAPLAVRIYQQIRREILEGSFQPGEPLPEDQLTRALGASRTPVREALMRLKHDGLVQISPRKGARVSMLDEREIDELFDAREVYETAFFDRAVKNIKRSEIKSIKDAFKEAEQHLDESADNIPDWKQWRIEYLNLDYNFHRKLISATENRFWIQTHSQLLNKMKVYSHNAVIKQADFFQKVKEEHHDILDAILSEDYTEAKWLLRQHIRNFRKRLTIKLV